MHIGGPVSTERGFVLHSDENSIQVFTKKKAEAAESEAAAKPKAAPKPKAATRPKAKAVAKAKPTAKAPAIEAPERKRKTG